MQMRALNLRNCTLFCKGHRFLIFVTADKMEITEYEYCSEWHRQVVLVQFPLCISEQI